MDIESGQTYGLIDKALKREAAERGVGLGDLIAEIAESMGIECKKLVVENQQGRRRTIAKGQTPEPGERAVGTPCYVRQQVYNKVRLRGLDGLFKRLRDGNRAT